MSTATFANDRRSARPAGLLGLALGVVATVAGLAPRAYAQQDAGAEQDAAPSAAAQPPLGAADLQTLVGPIALYPDDLIGIVLPASTYPLQVVEAARFLDARQKDASLKPNPDWDDSVVALLNYPDVLHMMNDDVDWTWKLGEAVLNQRGDVLDAVQQFRDRAYTAGNLRSDGKQSVKKDDEGAIAIAPANPEVVYVPYYEPSEVLVDQPAPVFHYYPIGYPLYYYPYPVNYAFDTGLFWGVTTAFVIGWHTHHLIVEHCGFAGHPYYGRHYYEPFYVRNDIHVNVVNVHRGGEVWQPRVRDHGRPFAVSDERRVGNPYAGYRHEHGRVDGGRLAAPREDARTNESLRPRSPTRTPGVSGDAAAPQRGARPAAPQRDARAEGGPKYQQRPGLPQQTVRGTERAPVRETQRAPRSDARDDGRRNDFVAGGAPRTGSPQSGPAARSTLVLPPGRRAAPVQPAAPAAVERGVPQRFERAAPQRFERAAPQRFDAAPPQRFERAAPQRFDAAPPQRVERAAPQRIERAAPQSRGGGGPAYTATRGGGTRHGAARRER